MDHFVWFLSTNLPRWPFLFHPFPTRQRLWTVWHCSFLFLGVAATIRHRVLVQISDTFIENIEEYICPGQRVEVPRWQMWHDRCVKKMVSWSCHGVTWSQELTCFTTCWLFSAPAEALVLQSPIDRMDRLATQKMRGISSFSGWFFCPFLGILNTSLAQLQISGDWYPRHSQWLGV